MAEPRQLPGGRGQRRGDDAWIDQQEAYQRRLRELPATDGGVVSSLGLYPPTTTLTATANQLRLTAIPRLDREVGLYEARLRTGTGSAGTIARTAIYNFANREFTMVAGTLVAYDAGVSGAVTQRLPEGLRLVPEGNYFVGFVCDSALPTFVCCSGNRSIASLTVTVATAVPPSTLRLESLTKSFSVAVVGVYYFSREFADVV